MNPSISFIGAGKVSTALGIYFKEKGFEIVGYLSRNEDSANNSAKATGSKSFINLHKLLEISSVIWITTPDDQIESVAKQIATASVSNKSDKLILHASGVHTVDILASAQKAGYNTAAAHPLLAFNDGKASVKMLENTWFAVEEGSFPISDILHKCGNNTFRIDKENKALYHAAACVLSNYMVTLLDISQKMFELSGLPKDDVASATLPLLESVINNINNKKGSDALTGPIKRGDTNTVQLHIDTLQKTMPEMVEIYKVLGRMTMQMISDYKLKDILD